MYICYRLIIKKNINMKKIFMLATAAFLVSGVAFSHDKGKGGKGKKACCQKGGGCCKDKSKSTAKM